MCTNLILSFDDAHTYIGYIHTYIGCPKKVNHFLTNIFSVEFIEKFHILTLGVLSTNL